MPEDLKSLERRLRILERQLRRSEENRARLEDNQDRMAHLHRSVIARMEESERAANEANLAKSRFLANMSHEIRTPMSGVVGVAHLLLGTDLTDGQRDLTETLRDASDVLMTLLDDVLDFSKIEAGQLELVAETMNPTALLFKIARLHKGPAALKGVQLRVVLDGLPAYLHADIGRVRQIVANLLSNAVKFTDEGRVELIGSYADGWLTVRLVDTGIGIPPELHESIFDPFQQQDESATRRFGGTGLGLAICRDLAHLMGGGIAVQSTVGVGSEITLKLPLPEVNAVLDTHTEEPTLDVSGLEVLLAEDSPVNRMVAERLLQRLGCKVTSVDNGQKALDSFEPGLFSLVLLDCQMPVLDGISAARGIRERDPSIPIIAVTASVLAGDRARCLEAGMNGFLSKPFTLHSLADIIARSL